MRRSPATDYRQGRAGRQGKAGAGTGQLYTGRAALRVRSGGVAATLSCRQTHGTSEIERKLTSEIEYMYAECGYRIGSPAWSTVRRQSHTTCRLLTGCVTTFCVLCFVTCVLIVVTFNKMFCRVDVGRRVCVVLTRDSADCLTRLRLCAVPESRSVVFDFVTICCFFESWRDQDLPPSHHTFLHTPTGQVVTSASGVRVAVRVQRHGAC